MPTANLPIFLQPKKIATLRRIGRDYDGGYLIDSRNVSASQALISLGVNDDWSFEEQFHALNPVPIIAYDGSVSRKLFRHKLLSALKSPHKPKVIRHRAKVLRSYDRFFVGDRRHIEQYVGADDAPGFTSLNTILAGVRAQGISKIFLKIDIEGWEYRLLDDVLANADLVEGLAIEFHDVDLHLDRLERFVSSLPLHLVHTHANNYGQLDARGVPIAIECTFSRQPVEAQPAAALPHPLDMSCRPGAEDYALRFVGRCELAAA
jgi:hypothetical protein